MPRPAGVRNKDFVEKRQALLSKLTDFALSSDLRRPSLRSLRLQQVRLSRRSDTISLIAKGLCSQYSKKLGHAGAHLWSTIATPATDPETAILEYFRISEAGMRHGGFVRAHAFGIIEGVADDQAGRAYLEHVLEPALRAVSEKLGNTPGAPQDPAALKAAAFAALSPMLVISLHQDLLGGNKTDPISAEQLFAHLQNCSERANGMIFA